MKHSIRTKITLLLTTMIVLTIFITWFVNRTFLSDYYIHSKIDTLNEAYLKVSAIYSNSEEEYYLTEDELSLVEQYQQDYDVDIYIKSILGSILFPTPGNIGAREEDKINGLFSDIFGFYNPYITDKKLLKETNNYFIFSLHDTQINSNYIDLIGVVSKEVILPNDGASAGNSAANGEDKTIQSDRGNLYLINLDDKMILIRSNLDSIEENVMIANEFLAYVGILAVVIGTISMFLISKKFTKPILDLAGLAKKMSDLDFEVKYDVKTKDEIGELGSSINALSDKLETTITELKQANNELLTDIQKKTEIDEMRKEFLSNVSHELKTPISLIQGYAEGLQENINEDQESRDYYCEVIIDEANKMNQMVKKLLSLNELEFGNNQINFERFDIVALIRSVLEATEILFRQKEVVLHFDQMEPVYVWADEYMVEQVVTNYISNALNHVADQKIIEIKLIPRGDTVRVAVFNTGENIPDEDLDKIWVKFYKVDKARTREYGGSGIGLSIVKAIMNSLNRECGVVNRPIGVEFWFELDVKS